MDESYHSLLAAGVEKKYRQLEMDIMDDIVRRIKKAGTITDAADWQIQRLIVLGNSTQDVEELVRKAVDGNETEVWRLYKEVIDREYTRDKSLYEKIGKEFVPYEQNAELQQITNALVEQSSEELYNITKSMGFMLSDGHGGRTYTPLSDVYNDYLDNAITGMANGAYDYNTLVRRMVNQMTASGLRSDHAFSDTGTDAGVQYAGGWHNRIDVAARRALLTGFGQLTGRVVDMNAQRLGTNYFEVTWHAGARPEHVEWQGKVYTKEQLVTVCGMGTGPGLLGWNCRHTYYPFIPGVSERLYTDEWLEEQYAKEARKIEFKGKEYNTYQATQKQRQMETALRAHREKVDLLRKAGADKDDITIAQCKYQAALDEYKRFSAAMHLDEQMTRVYTGRTKGRIAPSRKVYDQWKAGEISRSGERTAEKDSTSGLTLPVPSATIDIVEKTTGAKKGALMSIADAATGTNPNFGSDPAYGINCQRCVQAYELRRRGYDVIAKGKPASGNTICWGSECFVSSSTSPASVFTFHQTAGQVKKELKAAPEGARYAIYVIWKGSSPLAHVFIAEKNGGIVQYIDPQSGDQDVSKYFANGARRKFGYYRLDDKPLTDSPTIIADTVEVRSP